MSEENKDLNVAVENTDREIQLFLMVNDTRNEVKELKVKIRSLYRANLMLVIFLSVLTFLFLYVRFYHWAGTVGNSSSNYSSYHEDGLRLDENYQSDIRFEFGEGDTLEEAEENMKPFIRN